MNRNSVDFRSAMLMGWLHIDNGDDMLDMWKTPDRQYLFCYGWSPSTNRDDLSVFINYVYTNTNLSSKQISDLELDFVALWDSSENPNRMGYGMWMSSVEPELICETLCAFMESL